MTVGCINNCWRTKNLFNAVDERYYRNGKDNQKIMAKTAKVKP